MHVEDYEVDFEGYEEVIRYETKNIRCYLNRIAHLLWAAFCNTIKFAAVAAEASCDDGVGKNCDLV